MSRKPNFGAPAINAELVFGRFLDGGDLDRFEEILVDVAPSWCDGLGVWGGPGRHEPVDLSKPDALSTAVAAYMRLWNTSSRFRGSAELRGSGSELTLIVRVDERVVAPRGPKRHLKNRIALQVRRAKVEGSPGASWTQSTFERLCRELSPVWGAASHPDEYWAKVMTDGDTVQAIGRDFGRHLPGLFWLNFFGRPHVELIGAERLASAPNAVPVGDGYLIAIGDSPRQWDDPDTRALSQAVEDHLGPELFFSKSDPSRTGIAPESWS